MMAESQREVAVIVNCFTDENVLRHDERTITSMKIRSSGRATILKLIREKLRFPNLETLCFYKGCFNDSITRLITGLDKLKVLEFDQTTVENPKCIEQSIPTLEHLTVFNNLLLDNGRLFSVENVKKAIQLNPQLKGIRFRCDAFDQNVFRRNTATAVIQMLRFMNAKLQHLEYLGIHFSVDNHNDLKQPIVFRSVTKAMLYVEAYNFKWGPTSINFPIAFVQLYELELFSYAMYEEDCIAFVIKNETLEKLKFQFQWISESDDEEDCLVYDIPYEEDEDKDREQMTDLSVSNANEKTNGNASEGMSDEDDDEDDDDDDENIQYDCDLKPFLGLTKSLPKLKELSIGPITKFTGEDIVQILSPSKTLEMLQIKLRYPLHHRRDARYAGVTTIEQQMRFVKEYKALAGSEWSCHVEFKFKPGSDREFRIAHLHFKRNLPLNENQ